MLRNELAAVLDVGNELTELHDFIVRKRNIQGINTRNGRLGCIVEELVGKAFEQEGFEVIRTGVGSDFMVRPVEAKELEWDKQDIGELKFTAAYNGVPVEFLVEVKATRGDAVRVSWRQAETAANNPASYVLCVVDFADHLDLFDQVLEEDQPTCDLIAQCLALVPTIAQNLSVSVQNLNSALETHDPAVEVEKGDEIRFRISQGLWQKGSKLHDWAIAGQGDTRSETSPILTGRLIAGVSPHLASEGPLNRHCPSPRLLSSSVFRFLRLGAGCIS